MYENYIYLCFVNIYLHSQYYICTSVSRMDVKAHLENVHNFKVTLKVAIQEKANMCES